LEYNPLASDFEYRKKLAAWIPSLKQIDATMIGGLGATIGMTGMVGISMGGGRGGAKPTKAYVESTQERLRQLQATAIERAKHESQIYGVGGGVGSGGAKS
jgi:hypothetical protein